MTQGPPARPRAARPVRRAPRAAVLPALLLALALGACTGTIETGPTTLLIVASGGDADPRLQLVEDTFGSETALAERFRVLPGGTLDLPAPAVAMDLSDRLVARGELFVLSRAPAAPHASYLSRVDVTDLDPDLPEGFEETARLDLTAIVSAEPVFAGLAPCPTALQVTRDGRYAALLTDPAPCGSDPAVIPLTAVVLLDLEAAGGPAVERAITAEGVLPAGLYLDQAEFPGGPERLYYLKTGPAGADLRALTVPDGAPGTVAQVEGADGRDLAPALGALVALRPSTFQAVDLPDGPAADPVSTVTGATRVVPDPSGLLEAMLVLTDARLAVHASLEDAEPQTLAVTATGAAVVPQTRFGYLLQEGAITVIDLLGYRDESGSVLPADRHRRFPLAELTGTGPLSWAFAAFEPAAP